MKNKNKPNNEDRFLIKIFKQLDGLENEEAEDILCKSLLVVRLVPARINEDEFFVKIFEQLDSLGNEEAEDILCKSLLIVQLVPGKINFERMRVVWFPNA